MFKNGIQQGCSQFSARSVVLVPEHGKQAKTAAGGVFQHDPFVTFSQEQKFQAE